MWKDPTSHKAISSLVFRKTRQESADGGEASEGPAAMSLLLRKGVFPGAMGELGHSCPRRGSRGKEKPAAETTLP